MDDSGEGDRDTGCYSDVPGGQYDIVVSIRNEPTMITVSPSAPDLVAPGPEFPGHLSAVENVDQPPPDAETPI
jgi:hypothetical protein